MRLWNAFCPSRFRLQPPTLNLIKLLYCQVLLFHVVATQWSDRPKAISHMSLHDRAVGKYENPVGRCRVVVAMIYLPPDSDRVSTFGKGGEDPPRSFWFQQSCKMSFKFIFVAPWIFSWRRIFFCLGFQTGMKIWGMTLYVSWFQNDETSVSKIFQKLPRNLKSGQIN